MELKNKNEVIKALAVELKKLDLECSKNCNTTILLKYDNETQTGDLFTQDYCGNCYFNDDEYPIFTFKQRTEHDMINTAIFNSIEDIADSLEINHDDLITKVKQACDLDDDISKPELYYEIRDYVLDAYYDELLKVYEDYYLDNIDYEKKASDLMDELEDYEENGGTGL